MIHISSTKKENENQIKIWKINIKQYIYNLYVTFSHIIVSFYIFIMHTISIEKLDKLKYQTLLWMTIGFGLFFGSMIISDFINNKTIDMIFRFLGILGWLLFIRSQFLQRRLTKRMKLDAKLKNAINNEMHLFFMLKSYAIGYWTFLALVLTFIILSFFTELSMRISMQIILYFGVLSLFISSLIYNRN